MAGPPAFPREADCPEERDQGRDAKSLGDDCKGASSRVPDEFVVMVDVGPHGRNHGRKSGSFCKVRDDLPAFDTGIVILIDQEGLDDHEYLVHEWSDHVI